MSRILHDDATAGAGGVHHLLHRIGGSRQMFENKTGVHYVKTAPFRGRQGQRVGVAMTKIDEVSLFVSGGVTPGGSDLLSAALDPDNIPGGGYRPRHRASELPQTAPNVQHALVAAQPDLPERGVVKC